MNIVLPRDVSWFIERVLERIGEPYASWDKFLEAISFGLTLLTSFDSKTGWPYLLSSLVVAAGVFVIWERKGFIDQGRSFFKFVFPRDVYLHPSAIIDYKFIAIDYLIKPFTYLPVMTGMMYLTYKYSFMMAHWVWPQTLTIQSSINPILAALLIFLIADFGAFLGHYLTHKIPFLWYFHQVHHSAEVLTPITVHRWHPVDQLSLAVFVSAVTGVGAAIYTTAVGDSVNMATIFGLNSFIFIFYVAGFQLRHSHIWLSYGPILSWIFLSPAQHQIHHSTDPKHFEKNYGLMLSIWDALFRSLYVPRTRETLNLGLVNVDREDFSSVSKLFFLPFMKAVRSLRMGSVSAEGQSKLMNQQMLP